MPYRDLNGRRTAILIALTVVIAVFSSVAYMSFLRWNIREQDTIVAVKHGCEYLGRIFGTDHVVVVRCGDKIELREIKK